jgi:hypothetical protein
MLTLIPLWVKAAALASVIVAAGTYHWVKVSSAYNEGHLAATTACVAAAQQAQIDAAAVDMEASQEAARRAAEATADNERRGAAAQQRIADYERELARRGKGARCRISADDVRRLSNNGAGHSAPHPSPPRRGDSRTGRSWQARDPGR